MPGQRPPGIPHKPLAKAPPAHILPHGQCRQHGLVPGHGGYHRAAHQLPGDILPQGQSRPVPHSMGHIQIEGLEFQRHPGGCQEGVDLPEPRGGKYLRPAIRQVLRHHRALCAHRQPQLPGQLSLAEYAGGAQHVQKLPGLLQVRRPARYGEPAVQQAVGRAAVRPEPGEIPLKAVGQRHGPKLAAKGAASANVHKLRPLPGAAHKPYHIPALPIHNEKAPLAARRLLMTKLLTSRSTSRRWPRLPAQRSPRR